MNFSKLAQNLGLEDEEFMELVVLLIDTGRHTLAELEACLFRGDIEAAQRAAHTFKGAAGNLGFMQMHATAQALENAIKAQIPAEIDPLLAQLNSALEELASNSQIDPC